MGIFSNPSDVPVPGPPPKKETVRVELAGCGLLVKSFFRYNVECLNTFLTSVGKWPGLPCCPVQNVMPVSGPQCQLQPKTLVFQCRGMLGVILYFSGWVWFTLCYCCCLGCSLLPFCVNDFRV